MATRKKVTETAPASGGLNVLPEEPVVSGEMDDIPTVEEARAMFAERLDLASVLTTEGWIQRNE